MKKVVIPGIRKVCYMERIKDCDPSKHKEIYSKALIRATTHDEAITFFKKYVANQNVTDIVTTESVYIYIHNDEMERLEWM